MPQPNQLSVDNSWEELFQIERLPALEAVLPEFMRARRWFGGKARTIRSAKISETISLPYDGTRSFVTLVRIDYTEGSPQTYMLPLTFAGREQGAEMQRHRPQAVVARVQVGSYGEQGVLYDASWDKGFAGALLRAIERDARFEGPSGELEATPTGAFERLASQSRSDLDPSILAAEQSNTSVKFGSTFILKMYRRLEEGTNPDLEVGRFLTKKGFAHTPLMAGALEYRMREQPPVSLAILQGFVPNQGDAWEYTLNDLGRYLQWARDGQGDASQVLPGKQHLLDLVDVDVPEVMRLGIGPYLDSAGLLGRRTAEMHAALSSDPGDPDFAPEPFDMEYQRSMHEATRRLAKHAFGLVQRRLEHLPEEEKAQAQMVLDRRDRVLESFHPLVEKTITAQRTRCHGDYHLGQVLCTGSDFVIIDFEGEPVRPLAERRDKWSPLKDVAGMERSFHYAAYAALFNALAAGKVGPEDRQRVEGWADAWHTWVGATYLKEYLAVALGYGFLPPEKEELRVLLDVYLLEKATYEMIYELNNRPDWLRIPVKGVLSLVA